MAVKKIGRPRLKPLDIVYDVAIDVEHEKFWKKRDGHRIAIGFQWHKDNFPERLRVRLRRPKSRPLTGTELRVYSGAISGGIKAKFFRVKRHTPHGDRLLRTTYK